MQLRFSFSFRYDAKRTQDLDNFFLEKKMRVQYFFKKLIVSFYLGLFYKIYYCW